MRNITSGIRNISVNDAILQIKLFRFFSKNLFNFFSKSCLFLTMEYVHILTFAFQADIFFFVLNKTGM